MAGGFHDGASKLWITRIDKRSLDVDGFDDESEAIGSLIRCAMVRDSSDEMKARIRAVVDDALRHMDEDDGPASEGEMMSAETAYNTQEHRSLSIISDADIAREFWRRFGPIQVHVGAWQGHAAVAELEDDGTWISEMLPDGAKREEFTDGAEGFVAAIERARELVRRSAR